MSVITQGGIELRYADKRLVSPWSGFFKSRLSVAGAAGGGTAQIECIPVVPADWVLGLDGMAFEVSAAVTSGLAQLRIHEWDRGNLPILISRTDTSGGAVAVREDFGNPFLWYSSQTGRELCSLFETNDDGPAWSLSCWGRFYAPES